MKTQVQAKKDDRDNNRILRWLVIAIAVLVVGALSYNLLAHKRMGPTPDAPETSQAAPPTSAGASANGK